MKQGNRAPIFKIRDRSGYFNKIIKVGVPTIFYFDRDGEFEGMEVAGLPRCVADAITPYARGLLREVLRAVNGEGYMPKRNVKRRTQIPKVFRDALGEGKQ